MELIPILSTIILVATISTFILAIGAYILYKIRESRPPEFVARKKIHQAELVEPDESMNIGQTPEIKTGDQSPGQKVNFRNKSSEQSLPGYDFNKKENSTVNRKVTTKVEVPATKFTKYTQEGIVSPEEEKSDTVLKWR